MSLSPYASRKRSSEEDHYDCLQHATHRALTITREVVPSGYLHSTKANHTPQRPTIRDRRLSHSSDIWIDTDRHRTNMQSTTNEASTGGISIGNPIMKSPVLSAGSPTPRSTNSDLPSPCYVSTSPQFCSDPHPNELSPHSPAFSPRPITSSSGRPSISPTSPAYIPNSPKRSPTPPAYTPDPFNFGQTSPKISAVPGWSEYRHWQTSHIDSSLTSTQYAIGSSTPRADRSRTLDPGRVSLPTNETFRASDSQDGHTPVVPGTSLAYLPPSRQRDWSPSSGADSPGHDPQLHARSVDPGSPRPDVSSLQPHEGYSSGCEDPVDHEPQFHGLPRISGITPGDSPYFPGFNVAHAYEADSPGNGLQYNATPLAQGYRPYFPWYPSQVGIHAVDPPSSCQQTLNGYEELGTRSAREENAPPETPGSSPNNPIILSPRLGFSGDATLFTSNGQTNGAMRSERLTRKPLSSSSPSLRNPLTRPPKVSEPSSNGVSSLNSIEDDGTEDQSLTHKDQPITFTTAPTATLKAEVDKAISLVNKLGDPYLGRAVRNVYQWSKDNPEVARIMTSVLIQTPTVEEETQFQAMIQCARTHHKHADESMATPSLAEDSESDTEETGGSLVGEETSVNSEDMEEDDDDEYDASTASFPSVPSSPSTVKGDEVRDDLSAEAIWGAIAMQYMKKEQED